MIEAIALSPGMVGLGAIPAQSGLHFEESYHEHPDAKDGHEENVEIMAWLQPQSRTSCLLTLKR